MPSNVRTSVLAGLEQNPRHSMEEALKPVVALQNGGLKVGTLVQGKLLARCVAQFSYVTIDGYGVLGPTTLLQVKDMPVQLVPITTSHIAGSKKSPECRAILQPIGTR